MRRIATAVVLALGAILLASPPAVGGGGGCAEVTSGHSAAVDLKGFCVFPTLVRVPSGGEVTFTNYDEVNHIIVGAGYAWGSDGTMHQGDSFIARFARDGVYPFQCYLHPGMSGAVLVGDANARGAATSGGVTAPVPSDAAATDVARTPDIAQPAEPQVSSGADWWLLGVGVMLGAVVAFGMWRSTIRTSKPVAGVSTGR
jgi:plastocyanin